jgi:hypothetical protein
LVKAGTISNDQYIQVSKTDNKKLPQLRSKTLMDALAGAERTIMEYLLE